VRHQRAAASAVPVLFSRLGPDDVAEADDVHVAGAVGDDAPPRGDDEQLAARMAVPVGARAGGEDDRVDPPSGLGRRWPYRRDRAAMSSGFTPQSAAALAVPPRSPPRPKAAAPSLAGLSDNPTSRQYDQFFTRPLPASQGRPPPLLQRLSDSLIVGPQKR
jgi:hypothetical protein